MKRGLPWNDDDSSSDESSADDTDTETVENDGSTKNAKSGGTSKKNKPEVKSKGKGIDFDALSRHGYKGGLSVLKVPPPKDSIEYNLSWSTGKERRITADESEETFEEREKTRAALREGEQLKTAQTQREKNQSFSQKEKRKRDLGQASRGKNYVEEEKRLLRDNGVYSGFDS
ncbi:hypothetical protein DCAR_0521098 [Daucus carota subsp. sativus]|uniref:Uncharacterized protein n=1 Tax=Daucus carota subsp. sativus TaxID=79200 RepID=A0A164Z1V8_DAUCS|nr:PREDICTED: uncharacterized protein LOC108220641 [Daucus carota subsp. sativus]WOH01713.1 hypothetical protein DCAR_0521098 [Daucus carota subsp. sativus]